MKKLIISILFISFGFFSFGQNLKGYNVEALLKLEAKRAFVIDLDTFYATTQLSGIDTILVTKNYLNSYQKYSDTLTIDATKYDLTTGLATKQNTLTTGNLTENVTGLQFDATRQVIGGAAQLSLTSGYVIPTMTEQTNWDNAYSNRITSLTTNGSSGAASLVSNVLNIPNYTISGLGGQSQLNGTGFVKAAGTTISYDNTNYTSRDATHLGHVGNLSYDSWTNTPAAWAALPVGYSRMMASSIGTAGGLPVADHGYFTKVANRNSNSGWGGLWVDYLSGRNYMGRSLTSADFATWDLLYSDKNSNLSTVNWSVKDATLNTHAPSWGQVKAYADRWGDHASLYTSRGWKGGNSSSMLALDSRNINEKPNIDRARGMWLDFKTNSVIGLTELGQGFFSSVLTILSYGDASGNNIAGGRVALSNGNLYVQRALTDSYDSWARIWDSKSANLPTVNWTVKDATTQYHAINKGQLDAVSSKIGTLSTNYIPLWDGSKLSNSPFKITSGIVQYDAEKTFSNQRDIVDKAYVDAVASGNLPKLPVDAATTTNIALSGTQTIDGYSVTVGQRVLVKNQTTQSQNGVYLVASGAWARADDLDTWDELYKAYVAVLNGGQSGASYVCNIPSTGTLGTTPITWVLYSAPTNIIAGNGILKTGNTISADYGGTGSASTLSRSDHTQTASTITDFQTSVTNNSSVLANTAKVSNANHTGDVTGSTELTLATVNNDVGTFNNVTVNAKGLVTGASNISYLTSFSESDPIYSGSSWFSTTNNSTNWNTAFSWGNHATEGYLKTVPTNISAFNNDVGYLVFSDLPSFGTTAGTVTEGNDSRVINGQTAYGWGNHATAGYLTDDSNYAKLNAANIFTANQNISKTTPIFNIKSTDATARKIEFLNSSNVGVGNITSNIDGSIDIQGSSDIELNAGSGNNFRVTGSAHYAEGLENLTQTNFVGYNSTTGALSYYNLFPSAGIVTSNGNSFSSTPLYTAGSGLQLSGSNQFAFNFNGLGLISGGSIVDGDFMSVYDESIGNHYKLPMGGLKTYLDIPAYTAGSGLQLSADQFSLNFNGLGLISGGSIVDGDLLGVYDASIGNHYKLTMGGLKTYLNIPSAYTLPLAANGVRGGVQTGYTSTANNFALQLSSEKAFTAIPDASTTVKGIAQFNLTKFVTVGGVVNLKYGAIKEEDLAVSNAPVNGHLLSSNTSTGGFTWVKNSPTVQYLSGTNITFNIQNGTKGSLTLSGNTTLTITNLIDGMEGSIEITNNGTYALNINGSTGYTTEQIMGNNSVIKSNSHTTVVYWRSGSVLYYGFIYNN